MTWFISTFKANSAYFDIFFDKYSSLELIPDGMDIAGTTNSGFFAFHTFSIPIEAVIILGSLSRRYCHFGKIWMT